MSPVALLEAWGNFHATCPPSPPWPFCPHRDEPETLKEQLKEIIDIEQQGRMNPTLRLKKKALQQAYDQAIKRKMVGWAQWPGSYRCECLYMLSSAYIG
jgi:hypothetical protein